MAALSLYLPWALRPLARAAAGSGSSMYEVVASESGEGPALSSLLSLLDYDTGKMFE